jgi:hypothetical protein
MLDVRCSMFVLVPPPIPPRLFGVPQNRRHPNFKKQKNTGGRSLGLPCSFSIIRNEAMAWPKRLSLVAVAATTAATTATATAVAATATAAAATTVTTAASAAATTTTAVTTAASATTTTTATGTIFTRLGLVHGEGPAILFLTVQGGDGSLRFIVGTHLNESETLAAACLAVADHFSAAHGAVLTEQLFQFRARR